ncbi:MAG: hypothetical protein M3464_20805 [Chloroflexota bacterium]|nr:hypothetical protein [Chloroflexota bacterium]
MGNGVGNVLIFEQGDLGLISRGTASDDVKHPFGIKVIRPAIVISRQRFRLNPNQAVAKAIYFDEDAKVCIGRGGNGPRQIAV